MKAQISHVQWISWMAATLISALTLCAFMFTNFESKTDAKDRIESVEKRLDRIELKIDSLATTLLEKTSQAH